MIDGIQIAQCTDATDEMNDTLHYRLNANVYFAV